jgi:hypothetical protein
VKRVTKNSTFNNVPISEEFRKALATKGKAKKDDEAAGLAPDGIIQEGDESSSCQSDDEFINPVNSSKHGISLSVFADKNLKKSKYLKETYYRTPSKK